VTRDEERLTYVYAAVSSLRQTRTHTTRLVFNPRDPRGRLQEEEEEEEATSSLDDGGGGGLITSAPQGVLLEPRRRRRRSSLLSFIAAALHLFLFCRRRRRCLWLTLLEDQLCHFNCSSSMSPYSLYVRVVVGDIGRTRWQETDGSNENQDRDKPDCTI
jgi:hypothetical protein